MLQLNFDVHSTPTQLGSAATVAQHWHAFGFHYNALASICQAGLIFTNKLQMAGTFRKLEASGKQEAVTKCYCQWGSLSNMLHTG
jgi:hypothetical protein